MASKKDNQPGNAALTPLKLEILASAIVTLGEGIGTIAAVLALEEEIKQRNNIGNGDGDSDSAAIRKIQKQLDY